MIFRSFFFFYFSSTSSPSLIINSYRTWLIAVYMRLFNRLWHAFNGCDHFLDFHVHFLFVCEHIHTCFLFLLFMDSDWRWAVFFDAMKNLMNSTGKNKNRLKLKYIQTKVKTRSAHHFALLNNFLLYTSYSHKSGSIKAKKRAKLKHRYGTNRNRKKVSKAVNTASVCVD